jgi:hypothetical protein
MDYAQTAPSVTLSCTGSEEDSGTSRPPPPPLEPNNHVNINIVIADNAVAVDELGPVPVLQATPAVIKFTGKTYDNCWV